MSRSIMSPRRKSIVIGACLAAAITAAAAAGPQGPSDPLESINRKVDTANRHIDEAVTLPVARAYERFVPSLLRRGVSNFFANLGDAWSAANSLLQLKPVDAAQNTMRFAVNTVFGLGGTLDIATDAGIDRHKEDFGTTLARWGVPAGPYMVLPLLGPTTLRDAAALPVDLAGQPIAHLSPVSARNAAAAASALDARARGLPLQATLEHAIDRYSFMRDAYLQHRQAQIHGSAEPASEDLADKVTGEPGGPESAAATSRSPD